MADSSAGSTMKPRVMTKTQKRTRYIAVTAMLSAIATVLMYIEIVVPFMPSFIKLDLSDLPSLIGSFAMGPVYGVVIAAVKNLLHLFFTSSGGVGELSNFLLNAAFVLPAGLIYRFRKSKKGAIAGALTGAVVMAALSVPINYFIVYPFYTAFMPMDAWMPSSRCIRLSIRRFGMATCFSALSRSTCRSHL